MEFWVAEPAPFHQSKTPLLHHPVVFLVWPPRSVLRRRLLVFSEALICLSYSGKWLSRAVTLHYADISIKELMRTS